MNEFRKLMETISRIEEGKFSELDIELQELKARKPDATPEELVAHIRRVMGDDAAEYVAKNVVNLGEAGDIEFLQYPEGYEPPPIPERHPLDGYDWMHVQDDVISMMKSLEHKMKRQNVWDKGVELAGGEDELWKEIQYEAEDIMDSYRGSGEGIGTSDINHFVRAVFSRIGEDDIWGWDKKKEGIEEEVVEVPAGLRGEEGSDLSGRDAEQFINSLGPEDSPDTEVIDPDSGDVLDWPDRGTRRAQRDAEYQAQKEREEEEAWETPMLYTFDLKKHDDRSWDRISDFRFNAEYTDHYNVEWANIEDLVDDPQQYYEGDYDIGVDIPVKISRTDGKKFDKQDRENFKELYKLFRLATYNISVAYAGSSDEGKTAHFYPTFF